MSKKGQQYEIHNHAIFEVSLLTWKQVRWDCWVQNWFHSKQHTTSIHWNGCAGGAMWSAAAAGPATRAHPRSDCCIANLCKSFHHPKNNLNKRTKERVAITRQNVCPAKLYTATRNIVCELPIMSGSIFFECALLPLTSLSTTLSCWNRQETPMVTRRVYCQRGYFDLSRSQTRSISNPSCRVFAHLAGSYSDICQAMQLTNETNVQRTAT